MIILDEQLQGLGLEEAITRWYRGAVRIIKHLRPRTAIKDDEIPTLLRQVNQPSFVTINHRDFWRRISADKSFCMVCLDLSIEEADKIPELLRALFSRPDFRTKRARMGKVILIRPRSVQYYSHAAQIHLLP